MMIFEIDNTQNMLDEADAIENEDLVETILEIKAEGGTDDNQRRLVNGINEGCFLIPVLPTNADKEDASTGDSSHQQFEFMACVDESTGDKYLPLCTDKSSLNRFVDNKPHDTLCLPFDDIAMLIDGLDGFASVAISSRFFPADLFIPPSVLPILAANRDQPTPEYVTAKQALP